MLSHKQLWHIAHRAGGEETFEAKNVQVFVLQKKNINVVAFRGAELKFDSVMDIITCLKAWPRPARGGVHSGIWSAAKAASRVIKKQLPTEYPIILTGYSMGGAIALLCSELLPEYNILEVVTFGSPKVVRKPENFSKPTTQYILRKDIVPKFPGRFWDYKHVAPVEFGFDGKPSWKYHEMSKYLDAVGEDHG